MQVIMKQEDYMGTITPFYTQACLGCKTKFAYVYSEVKSGYDGKCSIRMRVVECPCCKLELMHSRSLRHNVKAIAKSFPRTLLGVVLLKLKGLVYPQPDWEAVSKEIDRLSGNNL